MTEWDDEGRGLTAPPAPSSFFSLSSALFLVVGLQLEALLLLLNHHHISDFIHNNSLVHCCVYVAVAMVIQERETGWKRAGSS